MVESSFEPFLLGKTNESTTPDLTSSVVGAAVASDSLSISSDQLVNKRQRVNSTDIPISALSDLALFPSLSDLMIRTEQNNAPASSACNSNSVTVDVVDQLLHAFPYTISPLVSPASATLSATSSLSVIRVVPIKNSHKLNIKFQLPPTLALYGLKLDAYYGHLLGHEGRGSILSALKQCELASGLAAGVCADNTTNNLHYSVFEINITLTNSGVANWVYVVAIIYSYLHALRSEGPKEWVYEELKRLACIEYGKIYDVCRISSCAYYLILLSP